MEVEADAEVVEIVAELEGVFAFGEAVVFADLEIFIKADVVAGIGFYGFADFDPCFGEGLTDVGELVEMIFTGGEDGWEVALVGEVGGDRFFEVLKFSA